MASKDSKASSSAAPSEASPLVPDDLDDAPLPPFSFAELLLRLDHQSQVLVMFSDTLLLDLMLLPALLIWLLLLRLQPFLQQSDSQLRDALQGFLVDILRHLKFLLCTCTKAKLLCIQL